MTLLVRAVLDLLDEQPSVIELGNQTLKPGHPALEAVIQRSRGIESIDSEGIAKLKALRGNPNWESAALYYNCLGFSRYAAIDINDRYGSLVMDLNEDLREVYGFTETFDLVTNNGTGEHIFDQAQVLRNMHNLTKTGGIMLHVMPMLNFVNHGFYCFQPCLYYALSLANEYQLLGLGLAHREGIGVMADLEPKSECLSPFLLEESRVGLKEFLGDAEFATAPQKKLIKRFRHRLKGRNKTGNKLGNLIADYDKRFKNMLVIAALRKTRDLSFRRPIQTYYSEDFSSRDMQRNYATASTSIAGVR